MEQFSPWTSTDVQVKGHILHLSLLHGVVPGVWVIVGQSFDCMSMSRTFVSHLYAINGG